VNNGKGQHEEREYDGDTDSSSGASSLESNRASCLVPATYCKGRAVRGSATALVHSYRL
jgi:hypothetical protein